MRGWLRSSQNIKKSKGSCANSGSMLPELRKEGLFFTEWIQVCPKRFLINQGEKSVNKERGQLSAKEEGVFNASKGKIKLLG